MRFKIVHAPGREWEAIYWGRFEQGPAVAHECKGSWILVPMDLKRYRDKIVALGIVDDAEREKIKSSITNWKP